MSDHLWPLLRLKAESDEKLFDAYRKLYIENYIKTEIGEEIEIHDWNGISVNFNPHIEAFRHAFSESSNYQSSKIHDIPFSKNRARRILWIKEVLSVSKGTIEKWHQIRTDNRARVRVRYALVVKEEKYVVVLQEKESIVDLEFITAFPATDRYLKYIYQKGSLIEIKKAPVLMATEATPVS